MKVRYLIATLLILGLSYVVMSGDVKSSLTFVIDDTGSMGDDIEQVKLGANAIFDKVMNSNSSQIEDFVLVTFNDPQVELRTITKDRDNFKNALKSIHVHGGGDCPEMAMGGIKLALEKSREGSSLYIFTDAAAKDFEKYEDVAALSQRMGCQIVFVLTGKCSSREAQNYLVYNELAKTTNGHVFHLGKSEVSEILKYVEESIESRKHIIATKTYPPGYGNTFEVPVDGDTKEIVIAVSGISPKVSVSDSAGTKWPTTDVTRLSEIAIVKVVGLKPDVYKVEVGSKSETHVVVSGSTSVHFQHGFSVITPSSISDTVPQPVPGENSHLSIKLATEGGEVELIGVQILDMEDNVILEAPLKLVDKDEQFYTTDSITPPNHMFKIAIRGYDKNSKTYLTRISLTPVKPQTIKTDVETKTPVVTIDKAPKIDAEYDKPLQLKCKVSGYPKPSVIWESNDKSAVFSHSLSTVELPYDYVSVLDIRNVKKNATYTCMAVNSMGDGHDTVETKITTFFNVLALPEDTNIEYQKPGTILCQVEGSPPVTVSWYKGRHPLRPDGNLELSPDGSVLTIRSMEPYMVDEYICEARNSVGRRVVPFKLDINGVEPPEIDKTIYYVRALKNSIVNIHCQVTRGIPKPTIHWWYKEDPTAVDYTALTEVTDIIHFDDVEATDAGTYRCIAQNVIGQDYHEIELSVEYKPVIARPLNLSTTANQGQMVTLACVADGSPTPDITWKHNGAPIRSSRHTFYRDGSLGFAATSSDRGVYECEARNAHGVDSININLDIIVPVDIESPKQSFIEQMVGLPVGLPCRADGYPKPKLTWIFRSKNLKTSPRKLIPSDASGELRFSGIQLWQSGYYTCEASNPGGTKNITYEVLVTAPPSIRYTAKQFRGVVDDMQLRVPCQATGYPKPDITWSINGYNIPSGSEWFDISNDGSLIIKNLDALSAGSYICTAKNKYGKKVEEFNVIVDPYPDPGFLSNSVSIEKGTSVVIPCSVPQKRTDRLRWFKDGRNVASSELVLRNVRLSDSGTYTCRVSYVDRPAQTGSTKVEVGFKPRFDYNDEKNIPFEKYLVAFMDCSASGEPKPEVTWYHDDKELAITDFKYELEMTSSSDKGRYTCYVGNSFGTIQQEFVISSAECLLDIKNDFNENEPLMLTISDELTHFEASDGYLQIPKDERIKLVCPSGFIAIPTTEVTVTCDNEKQFILQPSGNRYAYSDLKCSDKIEPVVKRTGRRCTNGNSEMLNIGFDIRGRFKEIYQVCLDTVTQNPIYTKLNMQQPLANAVANNDTEWFNYGSPVDLDSLYDCGYQTSEIASILDKDFHRYSGCCFARRMLVNPKDVAPGLPQAATYTHLNVVPHWGTCNSRNWEDLEQRVRNLVVSADRPIDVWTGTAQELQLTNARAEEKNVVLNSRGKDYQVPKYLWKVVQDPYTKASLVIIQVNVPDLKLVDARSHLLCKDVCRDAVWMQSRRWRIVNNGYTYCCSLQDFERAFRYDGVFPRYEKLLLDASAVPEEHYLHAI